jgi:hypothetical protein
MQKINQNHVVIYIYILLIQYVDGLRTLGHNPVATANCIVALYLHSVYVPNMVGFLLGQPQGRYWGNPWLQTAPKYQKNVAIASSY